jgi:hypothetical protein
MPAGEMRADGGEQRVSSSLTAGVISHPDSYPTRWLLAWLGVEPRVAKRR